MSRSASEIVTSTRARLGPVGVWSAQLMQASAAQEREAGQRLERLGYGSLWTGEIIGAKDVFAQASIALAATSKIVFGSGIANIWARHPATMQGAANTVGDAWPGRFIAGIGVSHAVIVDRTGQTYSKPLERMRQYLADMDESMSMAPSTAVPVPRVLAALRPKMLELARERSDGAHPYFVPPSHTVLARKILGPDRLLIPEQAVVLCTDPTEARRIARGHMALYLTLPNYINSLRYLGFDDADLAAPGSDRLVDAIVAWGDEKAIAKRVQELRDSGADHVLLQALGENLPSSLEQLERLAPAVLNR